MLRNAIYNIMVLAVVTLFATSCSDDYFDNINGVNGEGTGGVTLMVDFQPLAGADLKSRAKTEIHHTTGDIISGINDMCIVLFNEEGTCVDLIEITEGMYKDTNTYDRVDQDASNGQLAGETQTIHREIYLKNLSIGKFYIYAVANLGTYENVNGTTVTKVSTKQFLESESINVMSMSRESFKAMRHKWDATNYRNNCEMSGFFTMGEQKGSETVTGTEAPMVNVYPGANLHCWLRRLVSKVTVDFDASGLNPSTTVFIKEIRVRDIPYDCHLLDQNTASETVDAIGGLMKNSLSTDGIQTCLDLDADAETSHGDQWLALTSGCPTIADFIKTSKNEPLKAQLTNISHDNNAKSLFFYENMQGDGESKRQDAEGGGFETDNNGNFILDDNGNRIPIPDGIIDSPDSTDPNDPHYKDGKKGGTYVEVIGYYESYDQGNEGSGNIIYRFMLGKDAESNYDAERNHHYKLTLCFRGYANDYDWHIEYDRAQPPVTIPDEYYVSYGYNSETELPIKVAGEIVNNIMTVEIVRNDWFPSKTWLDERPAQTGNGISVDGIYLDPSVINQPNATKDPDNLSLGFLSLRKTHASAIGGSLGSNGTQRQALDYLYDIWNGGGDRSYNDYVRDEFLDDDIYNTSYNDYCTIPSKYKHIRSLGFRAYKFDGIANGFTGEKDYDNRGDADNADGSYRLWTKAGSENVPRQTTVYIPLYTRNRNLCKTIGYTGNNPYNVFQRRAKIRVKFQVIDHKNRLTNIDKTIDIIQATKLANPMAVWRDWNNAAPFEVHLKYLDGRQASSYTNLTSHAGGWSAEVEQGADWILLNGGKRKIYGGENSEIRFTYRPAGILSNPNQSRCGIILIKYHNYSCSHRIFVRQGYAPIQLLDDGSANNPYWHSFNLVTSTSEGIQPSDEGSMFRYSNVTQPIDAKNNVNDIHEWLNINPNMWKDHLNDNLYIAGSYTGTTQNTLKWDRITSSSPTNNATWPSSFTIDDKSARMPIVAEGVALRDAESTGYHFGVLYGDKATATGDDIDKAYRYKAWDENTHAYGMRGVMIYNRNNAKQVFLPIGSSGYGARKAKRADTIKPEDVALSYGWSAKKREVGTGIVRYSSDRISYMPQGTAADMPLLYDIFRSFGAYYWFGDYTAKDPNQTGQRSAIDFNYNTFDFNTLGSEPFAGAGTDACFIRLVQDTAP